MSFFDTCPGSKRIKEPFPENIKCTHCFKEIEIWSDETEATCPYCKNSTGRRIEPNCLDWCNMAEKCVGKEKFDRYKNNRNR